SRAACTLACAAAPALVAHAQAPSLKNPPAPIKAASMASVIARGDSLQLPGKWEAPPGDPLAHKTAGFAVTLCGAVFLTGLEPADAAANVGFFTGPLKERSEVKDTVVDRKTQTVRLTLKNGVTRVARRYGSQGCVPLPIGEDSVHFTPSVVRSALPPAATTPWPMGDVLPRTMPEGADAAMIAQAVNEAFGPDSAMTLAVVVTYKGQVVGEKYAKGITIHSPLESWSMGKSVTGTLVARLIQMGVYKLDQPAPFPEWQKPGDPRQQIRIMDIMRMSSGLRILAPQDPGYKETPGIYPDHLYLYTGSVNSYQWAVTRGQQWKPNTVGRYRNVDPVLGSYLVRLGAEKLKQDYHAFPTRALFDKIGMRDAIIYTDPYGNFLGQGAEVISARDWARLGNLYLQDGVWNGERLLPPGYVDYARTVAPAWLADGRPVYGGGFMWVNGDGHEPLPTTAFAMLGAGGQSAWMVPSHGLVIVRIGKYRGSSASDAPLRKGMATLMKAVKPVI
ncbi:MAG: serine hydrolase, partial [Gemmatimonadetes bacterium]|nr:serine hydrolase [Gemmatimonadota bacterium]